MKPWLEKWQLGVGGIVIMPISGIWLLVPPTVGMLARQRASPPSGLR